jgi:hypothetical protein
VAFYVGVKIETFFVSIKGFLLIRGFGFTVDKFYYAFIRLPIKRIFVIMIVVQAGNYQYIKIFKLASVK